MDAERNDADVEAGDELSGDCGQRSGDGMERDGGVGMARVPYPAPSRRHLRRRSRLRPQPWHRIEQYAHPRAQAAANIRRAPSRADLIEHRRRVFARRAVDHYSQHRACPSSPGAATPAALLAIKKEGTPRPRRVTLPQLQVIPPRTGWVAILPPGHQSDRGTQPCPPAEQPTLTLARGLPRR
jgi:hypothetical protein